MSSTNHPNHRLNRHLDRLQSRLPNRVSGWIERLREPRARWLRIPLGLLLILGGFLGFLPVLGFWMLPLGVLLLSLDIPLLKKPTVRALDWVESRWRAWKVSRNVGQS